jgi:cold shock CspA family protein
MNTSLLSSSYPGAIKPLMMLQLQERHKPADLEKPLFLNCITSSARPLSPLCGAAQDLELNDTQQARLATETWADRNWRNVPKRVQGRVKWYNQQKKYGFIIDAQEQELFVHRDDLNPVTLLQDPHLFMGEYVEFEPIPTTDGRRKAANVSGLHQGPLMCDHGKAPVRLIPS